MLRRRLTLASVLLCLSCLFSLTAQLQTRICARDLIPRVQSLQARSDLMSLDCRLYTPAIEDYMRCPSSTIKCFADEVEVLIQEWERVPHGGFKLDVKLEQLASLLNETLEDSGCFQCELSREQRAEKFLEDLLSTLEAVNSQRCP
ncbi:interleukin 15, like isoform X2 [Antennarius striatus]|uniref:interleukin 15, like isoform X2 n=1 Tax=Antennarius striatus TaxID=241820 RepID=UPI0035B39D64